MGPVAGPGPAASHLECGLCGAISPSPTEDTCSAPGAWDCVQGPCPAQPLAAAFTGSVTHLSGQGGAQGDEFGDGPEDQAPQLPHPKLPLIQTSVSWPPVGT